MSYASSDWNYDFGHFLFGTSYIDINNFVYRNNKNLNTLL